MKHETLLRKTTEFWAQRLDRNLTPDEAEKLLDAIPDFVERLYAWGAGDRVVLQETRQIPCAGATLTRSIRRGFDRATPIALTCRTTIPDVLSAP